MATVVEINGQSIQYQDWSITAPTSSVDVAPSASVTTTAVESVGANDDLTITIDGTVKFQGKTRSGGTKSELGGLQVQAAHGARDLFEDTVSLSLTTPTTEEVLQAAISAADTTGFTLSYSGAAITLGNDYNVEDRSVKRVFRDMMDRTSRVWWVDPAGSTIHVEPKGGRGLWQAIDTQADKAKLTEYDSGNVDTVRNSVTVVGTGEEAVRATVENTNSISTYGRRPGNSPYNVSYVTTQAEASDYAQELLVSDPLPSGTLLAGSNVGNVTQPLANYTVDITDPGKNVDAEGLVIESQTIQQGRAELEVGAGSGVSLEEVNRQSKSQADNSEPGSVYNSDRIADGAIEESKLVDTSVTEAKLADLAVSTQKLQNNAVINGKLDDLSVSETKVQDDAISTPKLVAEAVTAAKIEADTITAAEIAAGTITALEVATDTLTADEIAAGTITALEIATGTLTANEIDTLNLNTNQITIGAGLDSLIEFQDLDVSGTNNTVAVMVPSQDNTTFIGLPTTRFAELHVREVNADTVNASSTLAVDGETRLAHNDPPIVTQTGVSGTELRPETDGNCKVGNSSFEFSEIHAQEFISGGTTVSDGGDVLAGVADASGGLPEHLYADDDSGGVRVSAAAEWVTRVTRAQQERIETLEGENEELRGRIDELEERISALEDQA